MVFNSLIFFIFAGMFFLIWPTIQKYKNPKWIFLTIASMVFYGWWDWRFLFLIIFSGLIDFFAGLATEKFWHKRRLFLILSLCGNLGSLAAFKYMGFLTRNLSGMADFLNLGVDIPVVQLVLPIGISFYTFQSMSYTIDIFKGDLKPTRNVFHFFAYLSLFPQLVAGPIIRASHLLPQLAVGKRATDNDIWEAVKLIAYGFFKKVVVADNLGVIVDLAFSSSAPVQSMPYWWAITTFFAIQIYCDFSGYSDIARGLGKLMGYDFPVNFNHPYISSSLQEFWQRWHISLSTWFRDYLFYPLLQKKVTPFGAHRSMWITMVVSGLWHGAAWNFVIWGALHAFYFSIERITNWPKKLSKIQGGKGISTVIVIILVWISWVFFRSRSFGQAIGILEIMFNPLKMTGFSIARFTTITGFVLVLAIIREFGAYFKIDEKMRLLNMYPAIETIAVAFTLVACVFLRGTGQMFIYFQF